MEPMREGRWKSMKEQQADLDALCEERPCEVCEAHMIETPCGRCASEGRALRESMEMAEHQSDDLSGLQEQVIQESDDGYSWTA